MGRRFTGTGSRVRIHRHLDFRRGTTPEDVAKEEEIRSPTVPPLELGRTKVWRRVFQRPRELPPDEGDLKARVGDRQSRFQIRHLWIRDAFRIRFQPAR